MGTTNPNTPHIALLTFPFASHPGNLFTLTQMLASSATSATFSFFTSHQSLATLSSTPHPGNIRLHHIHDGCGPHTPPSMPPLERIGRFIKATPENFKAAMDEVSVKFSYLVADAFLAMMARGLAQEGGPPWVAIWTCGPPALLTHLYTDELRRSIGVLHENGIEYEADQQLATIPALSAFRITDLPEGIVVGDIHAPFSTLLHQMATNLPHATAVAINTFQGLQPDVEAHFSSSFKQLLLIGPFNLIHQQHDDTSPQNDDDCVAWLDRQSPASVAYISFGTVLVPPPAQLEELALGLEMSGAPFLWALKEKSKGELPAGFLGRTKGRGLVVSWAPQVEVLGHKSVGAFLTHCGWNSILESITSGVPMICKPFFGDQRANARTVERVWKIGVALKEEKGRLYRDDVARTVTVVLKEGDEMRGRSRELKQLGVQAAESGGSSVENIGMLLKLVCGAPNV